MKNTHSIRLQNFTDTPEGDGNVLFEAALPLPSGQTLPIMIEYDPQTRCFENCNSLELPPRWMTAIKKVAEKPIRDELYRSIDYNLFYSDVSLTVPIPR